MSNTEIRGRSNLGLRAYPTELMAQVTSSIYLLITLRLILIQNLFWISFEFPFVWIEGRSALVVLHCNPLDCDYAILTVSHCDYASQLDCELQFRNGTGARWLCGEQRLWLQEVKIAVVVHWLTDWRAGQATSAISSRVHLLLLHLLVRLLALLGQVKRQLQSSTAATTGNSPEGAVSFSLILGPISIAGQMEFWGLNGILVVFPWRGIVNFYEFSPELKYLL